MPEKAARIWRANGGYQNAPPPPSPPPGPLMPPVLVCYPSFGAHPGQMFGGFPQPYLACPPGQYPQPYGMPQPGYRASLPYVQGPVGVAGLCRPMPSPPAVYMRARKPQPAPSPPEPKKAKPKEEATPKEGEKEESEDDTSDGGREEEDEDEEEQEEEEAEEKPEEEPKPKKLNIYAPPPLQPNANYMYDWSSEITMLHIFNKASPIWEPRYRKERPKFKMFHARVSLTVKMVTKNVLAASSESLDPKEWAATEAIERGGGEWEKGSTVNFDSSRSDGSLMAMGWGPKRGSGMPPVWLVVHKVGFKK